MKLKIIALTILSASVIVPTSFASKTVTDGVHPPFIKHAVPLKGLVIDYSLYETKNMVSQKLVCIFEGFSGNVKYVENGVEKEDNAYGDPFINQQMYFTSIGQTWKNSKGLDSLDQFHVDPKAYVVVQNNDKKEGYATCFYQSETQPKTVG